MPQLLTIVTDWTNAEAKIIFFKSIFLFLKNQPSKNISMIFLSYIKNLKYIFEKVAKLIFLK